RSRRAHSTSSSAETSSSTCATRLRPSRGFARSCGPAGSSCFRRRTSPTGPSGSRSSAAGGGTPIAAFSTARTLTSSPGRPLRRRSSAPATESSGSTSPSRSRATPTCSTVSGALLAGSGPPCSPTSSWQSPKRVRNSRSLEFCGMPEAEVDRAADVDRVYEELKRAIDRDARDPASTRGLAERFWPVSADKPLERRPGAKGWVAFQVKRVLRRLMRWYVEPAFAEQRIVNDALLRLVDDLARRVDE